MAKTEMSLVKVSVNSPQALAKFANTLKKFIVDRKLYTEIKQKNYVHVEAWEFAGACMGVAPVLEWCKNVSTDKETVYHARVELKLLSSGKTVGAGEAICSSGEPSKKSFDEYAIASMAQTRATGKAFRLSFGWVMKMAGYEPTSAEEVEGVTEREPEVVTEPIADVQKRVNAKLDAMSTVDRIRAIKSTGHTNVKNLTEPNWRRLDEELS